MAFRRVGMGTVGAGGQRFMSSVLAKASMPGGYAISRTPSRRISGFAGGGYSSVPSAPAKPSLSKEARAAYERAIARYRPGGGFGKGVEAGLARGETKAVASGMQSLVSAGLAGTTMGAGLSKKYQEEVAAPARSRVEEARAQAISGLEVSLASAMQRGSESAQERSLRERLAIGQLSTQRDIAGMQTTRMPQQVQQPAAQPTARQHLGQVPTPNFSGGDGGEITGPSPAGLAWQKTQQSFNDSPQNMSFRIIENRYNPGGYSSEGRYA